VFVKKREPNIAFSRVFGASDHLGLFSRTRGCNKKFGICSLKSNDLLIAKKIH
jgi:hypothetical protein